MVDLKLYISMKLMVEGLVGLLMVRRNSLVGFVDIYYVSLEIKELARTHSIFMT